MSCDIESYIDDRYSFTNEILWSYTTGTNDSEYQEFVNQYDFGIGRTIKDTNIRYVDYILVYANTMSHIRTRWATSARIDKIGPRKHITSWIYRKPLSPKGLRTTHIDGYSEVIEYYHPQYNREIIPGEVDYRRTLYWNPHIEMDEEGKAEVTFYNNGTCRKPVINVNIH